MKHSLKAQLSLELKSMLKGYPKFVYSTDKNQKLDGIPVFIYHTIDPIVFEQHLIYLHENGYRTLTIHEFYDIITKKQSVHSSNKLVLLTIDDARTSVWLYGYPLLKKYKMHATVFVIPGLTEDDIQRDNLEQSWNGKITLNSLRNIDPHDDFLCNWSEIREMYQSGYVDIESHTLFHKEVFITNKVVDFITAKSPNIPYNFAGSAYLTKENLNTRFNISDFFGLPIFESAPLMLAGPKINFTQEFIKKCEEIYQKKNSNNDNLWKNEIISLISCKETSSKYFNLQSDSMNDVLEDLSLAREIIQGKLDKSAGNHLCLPWTIGNRKTVEVCKKLGIKSCFWGILDYKRINKPGDDPFYITRIKNDFLFRLPGKKRKSIISIYSNKLKRRVSGDKVY